METLTINETFDYFISSLWPFLVDNQHLIYAMIIIGFSFTVIRSILHIFINRIEYEDDHNKPNTPEPELFK